ncbi:hypothetical protein Q8F55_007836 [Vanrija albida]|uniref:Major facilitator superfamily (MFS) profile domain-containing protein n=1 Tax=Vanrija albida TaxID=181172 RepID=A0ABR3PUN7_9TREE
MDRAAPLDATSDGVSPTQEAEVEPSAAAVARSRGSRFAMTPVLAFSCFALLVGDLLFGYDAASFGGLLANPGFINQFGVLGDKGYAMTPLRTSLASSLAFVGKLIGCLSSGLLIERLGHRKVFVLLSVVSIVGVILELAAAGSGPGSGRLAQFIVGRIVVYISIGLVEVCVSMYQAEIVPPALRGFVVASLQLFLNSGSLIATGVNKAYSKSTTSHGWRVVTALQLIWPAIIITIVPFLPDSPRWLLSKDRDADAIDSLNRLRPRVDAANGANADELATIKAQLEERIHKAPWRQTLQGTNRRRTFLVVAYYIYQQITGQAFISTYQTMFYKGNGYADQAFTYPIINAVLSILAVLPCMLLLDTVGRRPLLMASFFGQSLFLFLLAGVGGLHNKTRTMREACVAFFMLYGVSYSLGGAPVPYLLGAELPSHALREKTSTIGTSINVVFAFATNFALPYMLKAMSFRVGWIFGGISATAIVFTFLFLPETKGLVLEDIDEVFSRPFNPFRGASAATPARLRPRMPRRGTGGSSRKEPGSGAASV